MASEDMDSLTFAAPVLIRNLMAPASANAKTPIMEYQYDKVLLGGQRIKVVHGNMCLSCLPVPQCWMENLLISSTFLLHMRRAHVLEVEV